MNFSGDLEMDCILLYNFLDFELEGSKSGTARKEMFEKGHNKRQEKGSYSITIGHTFRGYISPNKNRNPSKIFSNMYETTALSRKPYILDELKEFANLHFPYFNWTEIQVNFNWASPPHYDKGNIGQSIILGLGDYTGGELNIAKYNDDCSWVESIDIHDKIYKFDGSKYQHWTQPYQGNRMSIVFYNINKKKIESI